MSSYFDRIERQLAGAVETGPERTRPRLRTAIGSLAAAVITIAVVVIAATLGHPSGQRNPTGSNPTGIVLTPASGPGPGTRAALEADVVILRHRLHASFPEVKVTRVGDTVLLTDVPRRRTPEVLRLTIPGHLHVLDWEGNVLLPGGHTVASRLQRQDPRALAISQGGGSAAPGSTGAGGTPLYDAVKLAAAQHALAPGAANRRSGAAYFLFEKNCHPTRQRSCLLAGPSPTRRALLAEAPPGAWVAGARLYAVPAGFLVVQAAASARTDSTSFADPTRQYFVVRDAPALTDGQITNPEPSTDQAGNPDVTFGFSAGGERAFQRVTAEIAHRGALVSGFGQTLNQHLAVALDDRILTVPSIDFKTYPDGIAGGGGADITGVFTRQRAQDLATVLRFAPLAVPLTPNP
ncbi:MAG: SecD/SecF fusion protein [Solirubrobacteraceae bacterium]|jgi:hypothetical protein|nr:SecD/SecF fusion protein [Solirubrobacteraceae bacterium]